MWFHNHLENLSKRPFVIQDFYKYLRALPFWETTLPFRRLTDLMEACLSQVSLTSQSVPAVECFHVSGSGASDRDPNARGHSWSSHRGSSAIWTTSRTAWRRATHPASKLSIGENPTLRKPCLIGFGELTHGRNRSQDYPVTFSRSESFRSSSASRL